MADFQSTVLTYAEARTELTRSQIETKVRSGRWQQACRAVYITHNGPIAPDEKDLVALMASGAGAALAGLSALPYDGFTGISATTSSVVQPIGSSIPPYDELSVHWSAWLDGRDVHPARTPRRTRPARSLLDAASWATTDPQARLIVIAGVQQGVASIRQLRESLQRRGQCRRRALIVQSILDAHGGIQSLPERDFRAMCRQFALPPPTHQSPCVGPDGRYYLDVEWKDFNVTAEIHGIPHSQVRQWDGDLDRGNEIAITGRRQLTFSSYAIRHRQQHIGDQLRRMLMSQGWRPPAAADAATDAAADARIAVVRTQSA